jgi:cell division protein FtsL
MDVSLLTPLAQLAGFVIISIVVVISMRHEVRQVRVDVTELKAEVKQFSQILTELALQSQRIDMLDRRYEELRHGEGFVFPLAAKLHGGES